jgi:hypothetical protein
MCFHCLGTWYARHNRAHLQPVDCSKQRWGWCVTGAETKVSIKLFWSPCIASCIGPRSSCGWCPDPAFIPQVKSSRRSTPTRHSHVLFETSLWLISWPCRFILTSLVVKKASIILPLGDTPSAPSSGSTSMRLNQGACLQLAWPYKSLEPVWLSSNKQPWRAIRTASRDNVKQPGRKSGRRRARGTFRTRNTKALACAIAV